MREELLAYFYEELEFLQEMGKEFAQKHASVASRFNLNGKSGKWGDPHVDMMVDAFALLAARTRLKIDDEFSQITEAFLNNLYPHYLAPVPSMMVAQLTLDADSAPMNGYEIKRGSKLDSPTVPYKGKSYNCEYRTCYPVALWPITIEAAVLEPVGGGYAQAKLRISLRCWKGSQFSSLKEVRDEKATPISKLRFYLHSDVDETFPYQLYNLLFNSKEEAQAELCQRSVANRSSQTSSVPLRLRAVGFDADEVLIGCHDNADGELAQHTKSDEDRLLWWTFPGFRLLTEYFAFPQKFLFFDVEGLEQIAGQGFGAECDLVIHLRDVNPLGLGADNFRLGCTPAINLFRKTASRIELTPYHSEYQVIPEKHEPLAYEIYSVDKVSLYDSKSQEEYGIPALYSLRHSYNETDENMFWSSARRQRDANDQLEMDGVSRRRVVVQDHPGTEIYLSLVHLENATDILAGKSLYVDVACFNRELPKYLRAGVQQGNFHMPDADLVANVQCLAGPTPTRRLPSLTETAPSRHGALGRDAYWRLISHLSLNHLSLTASGNEQDADALRETLHLYEFIGGEEARRQILGIKRISRRPAATQPNAVLWGVRESNEQEMEEKRPVGIIRGLETTIEFDAANYRPGRLFLFASVLERFFGLSVSINSFNRLVAKTEQKVFKRWPPRMGEQMIL